MASARGTRTAERSSEYASIVPPMYTPPCQTQLATLVGEKYSMGHWITAIALLVLATPMWAATRTAASCSASDVQAAINASVDGDTVLIPNADCPSGSPANWTAAVTVTTGIFLNAQGSYIAFGSGGSLTVTGDTVHGA